MNLDENETREQELPEPVLQIRISRNSYREESYIGPHMIVKVFFRYPGLINWRMGQFFDVRDPRFILNVVREGNLPHHLRPQAIDGLVDIKYGDQSGGMYERN